MIITLKSEKDIPKLVDIYLKMSKDIKVALLYGDLGAGKTTFVKKLVETLGSTDETSSPTYSLVNEYEIKNDIFYHIDLYRLETETEAIEIGIEDYIYSGRYCLVEWPQVIEKLIIDAIIIKIKTQKDNSRVVEISRLKTNFKKDQT